MALNWNSDLSNKNSDEEKQAGAVPGTEKGLDPALDANSGQVDLVSPVSAPPASGGVEDLGHEQDTTFVMRDLRSSSWSDKGADEAGGQGADQTTPLSPTKETTPLAPAVPAVPVPAPAAPTPAPAASAPSVAAEVPVAAQAPRPVMPGQGSAAEASKFAQLAREEREAANAASGEKTDGEGAAPKKMGNPLKQPLKLPFGKGGGAGRSGNWPTKTSMNLIAHEKASFDVKKAIPLAIVLVVAVIAFAKFGVFDQLARVSEKERELGRYSQTLHEIEDKLTDYDKVSKEFEAYNVQMTSTGIDVQEVLTMVEATVSPVATITAESIEKNVLTVELLSSDLDTVGRLAKTINENPLVENVILNTAENKTEDGRTKSTMTVVLVSALPDEDSQAESTEGGSDASSSSSATTSK